MGMGVGMGWVRGGERRCERETPCARGCNAVEDEVINHRLNDGGWHSGRQRVIDGQTFSSCVAEYQNLFDLDILLGVQNIECISKCTQAAELRT